MSDQLLGILLGGILTVIGGFAGTAYLRWRDVTREKERTHSDLVAAERIVIHELSQNWSFLKNMIGGEIPPTDLTESSYRSVELVIARHLPKDVRSVVSRTYSFVAPANSIIGKIRATSAKTPEDMGKLSFLCQRTFEANQAMKRHLIETLKDEV